MPTITFDRFEGGLDLRQGRDTADANKLRDALNIIITAGRSIRKRPGTALGTAVASDASLRQRGLVSVGAGLGTFVAGASTLTPTAGNTVFYVPHPTTPQELAAIWFAQKFAGYWYIAAEYADGSVWHHYLDAPGAWQATTAYSLTDYRTPTTPNGYRYECTTAGTSGGTEPTWPTTVGGTVADGTAVWTCRAFTITDANCPHSKGVIILESHIFAVDGEVVRFCAVDDARDWTTSNDAGFLATGRAAVGSDDAQGLATYQGKLAVLHQDSMQIYTVDPDPALMAFAQGLDGYGTRMIRSAGYVGDDTFILTKHGFRSLTTLSLSERIGVLDVGSAVDEEVADYLPSDEADALINAEFHSAIGSYVCAVQPAGYSGATTLDQARLYCYSYSRTAKISAWSRWRFGPAAFTYACAALARHMGRLYVSQPISGLAAYVAYFDPNTYTDRLQAFPTRVEFPLLDFKKPASLKAIYGFDVKQTGRCDVSFIYQYLDDAGALQVAQTDTFEVVGSTPAGGLVPVELCVVAIAPVFETLHDEEWELHAFSFHFEDIGVLP